MKIEYAKIIHDIVEQGLDAKYLAHLIERCDTKQVHELVGQFEEVALFNIDDRIDYIKAQIEEL